MKYCVEVCLMQYGYVHVDADSKAEAENLARELYDKCEPRGIKSYA